MDLSGARAVLFDKDGTLFDFQRSWRALTERLLDELSNGDPAVAAALAEAAGYDSETGRFRDHAPAVSGTLTDVARAFAPLLPDWPQDAIERLLQIRGAEAVADLAPAVDDLPALLDRLRAADMALGVATHDGQDSARAHLARVGALDRVDFIAGYDSGWPPKPDPAVFHAFADATGRAPDAIVMVGDSFHDLRLGRAGGALASIGVLTGPADAATLAPEADLILPSIAALPHALGL